MILIMKILLHNEYKIINLWYPTYVYPFFYFPYNYKNRVLACFQTRPHVFGCGLQVYVADVESGDVADCHNRSTHKRPLAHVQKLAQGWEPTPRHLTRVDLTTMVQDVQIQEVSKHLFI